MLKIADLANRADFDSGALHVSPARRLVTGPEGSLSVEPIVMKVFLLLLDAGGSVVTRDDLFAYAWGGVFVGDDSLNRAIGRVRKIATDTAPGLFEIETIPRTGYRLTGDILSHIQTPTPTSGLALTPGPSEPIEPDTLSRRLILGGGAAAAAILGGGALWRLSHPPADKEFDSLIAQGETALKQDTADARTTQLFSRAAALQPNRAKAWGLLAYMQSVSANEAPQDQMAPQVEQAGRSAARAIAIDPRESNALTAMALVQEWIDGWAPFERRLRQVLAISPTNTLAMAALVALLQAGGLNRESWNWNQRALAIEPLSPVHVYRKALKLWIAGRVGESYKVIDRAADLWPTNLKVWNARFLIFAFGDRAPAALAMLHDQPAMLGSPAALAMWQRALAALQNRTPETIAAARDAILNVAGRAPGLAAHGVMVLGALDQVDAAFKIANGFLLSRGPVVVRSPAHGRGVIEGRQWKWTQWLFTPPAASLRKDPRFGPLCDGIGLTEYWHVRGVRPDYQLARA